MASASHSEVCRRVAASVNLASSRVRVLDTAPLVGRGGEGRGGKEM